MRRKLFLHVGCHRTATTAIQQFLVQNFDALISAGILVPFRVGRHFDTVNALNLGIKSVGEVAKDLHSRADSKQFPINSLVLSDEDICTQTSFKSLASLNDHFDVKILLSIRRQDTWLESWYLQNIKWQWNPELSHVEFNEFLDHAVKFHWLNYAQLFQRLARAFGRENVVISIFDPKQKTETTIANFATLIGIHDLKGLWVPPRVNISLSPRSSEVLRHLPLDRLPEPHRQAVQSAFEKLDDETQSEKPILFSLENRKEVLKIFDAENTALAKTYFGRNELFDSLDHAKFQKQSVMRLPETSKEIIDDYFAPFLIALSESGQLARGK